MRLAVVLGSSAAALDEFESARQFLSEHGLDLYAVCVNNSIRVCPVKPHAFCSILSAAPKLFLEGVDTDGVLVFTRRAASDFPARIVKSKWHGTGGLYAVQIALEELHFDGVILAGVPIDAGEGKDYEGSLMDDPDRVERYRPEWLKALPVIGPRTRSMSGWTRELLGEPSADWLAKLADAAQAQ